MSRVTAQDVSNWLILGARNGATAGLTRADPAPESMIVEPQTEAREPLFNVPGPALVVVLSIVASYALEALTGPDAAVAALGFSPADLDHGLWWRTVTIMFVHAGWAHAITNAVSALAFGPPVARALGSGVRGALLFFAFYLVCGVLSSLAYAVMHLHGTDIGVGASGAVSGLMGASSRMLGPRRGPLASIFSRPALSIGAGWVLTNAILSVTGVTPFQPGVRILWEAHIGGFLAGLLLIGFFVRLASPADPWSSDRTDVT